MNSVHLAVFFSTLCCSSAAFAVTPDYRSGILEKQSVARYGDEKFSNLARNSSYRLYGVHVCAHSKVVMVPVREMQSYCKPVYQSYLKRCDNSLQGLCTGYRMVYEVAYRSIQRMVPKTQSTFACCPGWAQRHAYDSGCKRAICRQPCQNNGICDRPDHCVCPPGWTGSACEADVDECSARRHVCEQVCVNLQGSYRCACNEGFALQSDQRSCRKEETKRCDDNDSELQKKIDQLQERLNSLEEWKRLISLEIRRHPREDQIISLSEQMAILEETMEKCACYRRSSTAPLN